MGVDQRHSAVLGNPIEFSTPYAGVGFAQNQKERRILRQCIGKLDVALSVGARNPKREDGGTSSGWGSKGSVSKVEAS